MEPVPRRPPPKHCRGCLGTGTKTWAEGADVKRRPCPDCHGTGFAAVPPREGPDPNGAGGYVTK